MTPPEICDEHDVTLDAIGCWVCDKVEDTPATLLAWEAATRCS